MLFRSIDDKDKYKHMGGKIKYNDAVIVYLNGSIVYTGNVPSGGYASNQDMGVSNSLDTIKESVFYIKDLSQLREKKNVLAVEVHREDVNSNSIFFDLPYLKLFEEEKEEYIPNTKGIILLQGKEMDEIDVNWITASEGAYKIEYVEKKKDEVNKSTFSRYSNNVILGSKKLKDEGYINSGTITRLKSGTDYLYRVIEFGATKGSQIYEFTTVDYRDVSFVFPGTIETNDMNIELWEKNLKKALDLCGERETLILGKDKNNIEGNYFQDKTIKKELDFRSAIDIKERPVIITSRDQMENQHWAYSDMLLINIDGVNKDFKENKEFIQQIIKEKNRRWSMIIMNTRVFEEDGEIDRKYEELFKDLDVDLVIYKSISYSRYDKFEAEYERQDIIKKSQGDTVYMTGGIFLGDRDFDYLMDRRKTTKFLEYHPCIIKIKLTRAEVIIETFRIEEGVKVDSLTLIKDYN